MTKFLLYFFFLKFLSILLYFCMIISTDGTRASITPEAEQEAALLNPEYYYLIAIS